MKGIVLAGGTGSRLLPLTQVTNKHLLPIGRKPMIVWSISKFVNAGITDIMVVTGVEHAGDFMALLGSGRQYGCELTYRIQEEAGGIAQALGMCENFVGNSNMCVLLADNVFSAPLSSYVSAFEDSFDDAMILIKRVPDPERFGVVEVHEDKIVSIEEKPEFPKSDCIQTGIYFYRPCVFSAIRTLTPSARGELEIADVNASYMRRGTLGYAVLQGYWSDAGTFQAYFRANQAMALEEDVDSM